VINQFIEEAADANSVEDHSVRHIHRLGGHNMSADEPAEP
jgi:hypothetical protein